jgi:hypothetical protein
MFNKEFSSDYIQYALKRRTFKNDNTDEKSIKRFKTSFKNEDFFQTNLQHLPNELFYQIFSYLTDGEMFSSFYLVTKDGRFDE